MTTPANVAEIPDGRPRATPIYLVDASGNPITSSNGQQVTITNANANGQATMANSAPVAIASNQSQVPVTPYTNATAWPTGVSNATAPLVGIGLNDGGIVQLWRDGGDVVTNGATGAGIGAMINFLYNNTNYDAYFGNLDNIVLLASAARTTTQTVADQTNYNGRGVIVTLDVTSAGTGSITLEIDMKDPVSGKYKSLLTGAAVTTNVTNIYTVYPGAPATANVSANAPLPRTWRVVVTANNANTITYSCGASIIL